MSNLTALIAWISTREDSEKGAGLAEYALLLFLIAVACFASLEALGGGVSGVFTDINDCLGGGGC